MKELRICFIGDSFVNGTGDPTGLGWAGRLCVEANQKIKGKKGLFWYDFSVSSIAPP